MKNFELLKVIPHKYYPEHLIKLITIYNDDVIIKDKTFRKYFDNSLIQTQIKELSKEIKKHYFEEMPIFLIVMNGSFMFASDLLKHFEMPVQTEFITVSSYHDIKSSGEVKMVNGIFKNIENKKVIIIEDIIDTGLTMNFLINYLKEQKVSDISICSLLNKPSLNQFNFDDNKKFIGFDIENDFVIGYGLDYNNVGRNLKHLYKLI